MTAKQLNQICLLMLTKNCEHQIECYLDSTLCVIDMIYVIDCESTDNTVEVIQHWSEIHDIPTTIERDHFNGDFTIYYNKAFANAKDVYLEASYFLLGDVDQYSQLEIKPEFDKHSLIEDCYSVCVTHTRQAMNNSPWLNNDRRFRRIFFIKADLPWVCRGGFLVWWELEDCELEDLDRPLLDSLSVVARVLEMF